MPSPTRVVVKLLSLLLCAHLSTATPHRCPSRIHLAIGSYTRMWWFPKAKGAGLTFATFRSTGFTTDLVLPNTTIGNNPSYCAIGRLSTLYCVMSERVSNLSRITPVGEYSTFPTDSDGSTHLSVLPSAGNTERVLTANYGDGSVSSLLISQGSRYGRRRSISHFVVPPELGATETGQQRLPHPHHILPLYDGTVLVTDLGADLVWHLSIGVDGKLKRLDTLKMRVGDGPRHSAHGKRGSVYVVNELSNTVARVKGCGRGLRICEHVKLTDGRKKAESGASASAIRVSEDTRFLYVSLRPKSPEHGYIIAFELGVDGGIWRRLGIWSSLGEHPRDMIIIENGPGCKSYLAVANRDSDHIVFIPRDKRTGRLGTRAEFEYAVSTPVSVLQVPVVPGLLGVTY